jgi:hypothetical protein
VPEGATIVAAEEAADARRCVVGRKKQPRQLARQRRAWQRLRERRPPLLAHIGSVVAIGHARKVVGELAEDIIVEFLHGWRGGGEKRKGGTAGGSEKRDGGAAAGGRRRRLWSRRRLLFGMRND